MLRLVVLSLAVTALAGAAQAADLPRGSHNTKLGAVFAKPHPGSRAEIYDDIDYPVGVFAPHVDIPPLVNGYYGKPGSYYYRPYYGHGEDTYTRLPYACSFFGYC